MAGPAGRALAAQKQRLSIGAARGPLSPSSGVSLIIFSFTPHIRLRTAWPRKN
jgi:hypothetical protein